MIETSKQEAREEGITIGRKQGRKEGITIGTDKGILIGREEERLLNLQRQRALLLKQLSKKLGEIPNSIVTQINQLSMESLETLSEMLFDFNSLEDLENWLDNKD